MANVRNLKKDINYVLGDIIEAVYFWEYENTDKDTKKSEAICHRKWKCIERAGSEHVKNHIEI